MESQTLLCLTGLSLRPHTNQPPPTERKKKEKGRKEPTLTRTDKPNEIHK